MTVNSELGRIPVTIIEIDQDLCANQYGVAPCTAAVGGTGAMKCFNGLASCQDVPNYAKGQPLTLRFSKPHSDMNYQEYIIPSVQSVSTSPMKLNIGGRSGTMKPLGKRSSVTITLIDHPHSDNLVDPYVSERDYDPLKNGTFWSKWLIRNPYYNGRALRVLDGYHGQLLSEMQTRHFVIESITLPNSNNQLKIKAQDVLRLADDDKAQAPKLSTGKLLSDITATQTTLVITGGTAASYQQNGTQAVRISDEIIRYTGLVVEANGDITLSGLTRGSDNTVADEYEAEDTVQGCIEYIQQRPDLIAYDLLTNYGNINTAFIDQAAWILEAGTWLESINGTRLLSEPTGVTKLLGQLCEEFYFYIWWDEIQQLIRLKAISPVFGSVPLITESRNLIQNKTSLKAGDKLRVSEIWVSYLQKSPVEKANERESYKRTYALLDLEASGSDQYGERIVYEIFSPWLTNESHVGLLSQKLMAKYRNNPVSIKFTLDAKDRWIDVADVFDIEFRALVDFSGKAKTMRYQVVSKHERIAGETIEIEAVKFDYDINFKPGRWMADVSPDYVNATEQEKFNGMWYADENGEINGDEGYVWS